MCLLSFQVLKTLQKLKDLDITLDILAVSLLNLIHFDMFAFEIWMSQILFYCDDFCLHTN